MEKPKLLDVVNMVVAALEPFSSDERKRIIKASLTVLEEEVVEATPPPATPPATPFEQAPVVGAENIHPTAQRWMKTYNVTRDELDQVFHIEKGSTTVLSIELPGSNKRANTHSTYVLAGIASLIATGESNVDDKVARELCENLGCYDSNNHAVTMKEIGNVLNGSKAAGYKLTAPGLKEGASLVKKIAGTGKTE
jgi:hypothetical protein